MICKRLVWRGSDTQEERRFSITYVCVYLCTMSILNCHRNKKGEKSKREFGKGEISFCEIGLRICLHDGGGEEPILINLADVWSEEIASTAVSPKKNGKA